jgi:nucleoside-diphosphate-sugar epimerase
LRADINDRAAITKALADRTFDVIVNWVAYTASDVERDIELFRGKTRQYIFISSASAYQKPAAHYLITEATPLANPHWEYSRNKIACEARLMRAYRDDAFPVTVVRPSLTYGDTQIPLVMNSWTRPYTIVDRMLRGKKVIVPGDGTSLWVITHNSDFAKGIVGLMGNQKAIGEVFQITSDEVRTWDQYYHVLADAVGVKARIVHIPSDFIVACMPEMEGSLIGDKSVSCVFDNSKITRFVPDYRATTCFDEGIRRTMAWFNADHARQVIDAEYDVMCDKLIDAYERGLNQAIQEFSTV